jgi:hypothetical protein
VRNQIPAPSVPVYRAALGFKKTADLLLAESPADFDWVYPFIANASFSIELFLKSCLAKDEYTEFKFDVPGTSEETATWFRYVKSDVSEEYRTHNLTDLFGKISEKRKSKIKGEYQKATISSEYPKIGKLLSDLNGLFEAARYGYSSPNLLPRNISSIIYAAEFFQEIVPKLEGIE